MCVWGGGWVGVCVCACGWMGVCFKIYSLRHRTYISMVHIAFNAEKTRSPCKNSNRVGTNSIAFQGCTIYMHELVFAPHLSENGNSLFKSSKPMWSRPICERSPVVSSTYYCTRRRPYLVTPVQAFSRSPWRRTGLNILRRTLRRIVRRK